MPGWYIHSETAKVAAQRLSDNTDIPAGLGFTAAEAARYGDLCHKWRNFLAIGAIGPDMFYLLPDYLNPIGNVVFSVADWLIDFWTTIDDLFVGSWEKWMGPVGANDSDLTAQLTGGLSNQLAQGMDEISSAMFNAKLTLISRARDIFGLLTSGVPRGLGESAFYWSDMFHYRRTYDFPREMARLANAHLAAVDKKEADLGAGGHVLTAAEQQEVDNDRAAAESELAFAIGWITHCATDVTGHPFTNAKCGGPFRLHWQRHHLVENHFDAAAYDKTHMGATMYEEIGTSAMHFRVAFRTREDPPYNGCHFAPAYDYFSGFPAYTLSETAIGDEKRSRFFDMDPDELPDHLVMLLLEAMTNIYGNDPKILIDAPAFNDGGSGRPNAAGLNVMWNIFFRYLKLVSSSGLHPRKPVPPTLINEHPFPTPPGGALPADDGRGSDPDDDSGPHGHSFNLIDFLIAVVAWIKYIGQVVEWLLTVLPGLGLDVATFPAREFIYYTIISPLWSLYMASRKLLVLEGFLTPKPEEVEGGLVTMGLGTGFQRKTLADDLLDPTGFANTAITFGEPSGRAKSSDEWEVDRAFPRQSVKDAVPQINQFLSMLGLPLATGEPEYSHWVAPWLYPDRNLAGARTGWEPDLTHVGPWLQGSTATQLLDGADTHLGAAAQFEAATTPKETSDACAARFPSGQHLGNPIDYSLYLIKKLGDGVEVPNFNLDSDRGYGWHCWDWERHAPADPHKPPPQPVDDFHVYNPKIGFLPIPQSSRLDFEQPCTTPEQFDAAWSKDDSTSARQVANRYQANVPLKVRYLDPNVVPDPCGDLSTVQIGPNGPLKEVSLEDREQAGMNPDGTEL
jgi:hypothetical protein